jgi:hypothetical protein
MVTKKRKDTTFEARQNARQKSHKIEIKPGGGIECDGKCLG